MPQAADADLIDDVAAGRVEALRALYTRHADRVYNTALTYLQRTADAEEVTQDVFTKVWRNAASFKRESQFTTWLYRITVNTSLTALKKRQRRSLLSLRERKTSPVDFDHPGSLLEDRERNRALFAAIYGLPDRQKTAFVLSFVEELPRQQVADIMEVSLKSIEGLLMRSKKQLRVNLESTYPNRKK
ncbi:RNA polymerase sigma factor [Lewinella sp. 4G2]|uniref:RNA polymerase sigma factor n=1 Tax=Lewinella sp. 4G2 TaxID=1803372 RepID=UPI0007B47B76|nr:sigma-70 family RNA polymerase sigma factor [Lewinella sp. 4G2]OAV43517.1 RNA polymerase subunit sigma-70 [Lewinella sp. 4G2]